MSDARVPTTYAAFVREQRRLARLHRTSASTGAPDWGNLSRLSGIFAAGVLDGPGPSPRARRESAPTLFLGKERFGLAPASLC